jgi:hypothetical protein
MGFRHSQPADRLALEVEFNQYGRLFPHHPCVVPRLDRNNLWSGELQDAAVGILNMDLAASEEPHMRVHAEIAPDDRFHLSGPAESGRVDHTLDAPCARSDDVQSDAANFAALGSLHGCEQWIGGAHIDSVGPAN